MTVISTVLHPSGRFQLMETPEAMPGQCVVCGNSGANSDGRQFIDFGYSIDDYGAVIWCEVCLTEACNALGWINQRQWLLLQEFNEQLTQRVQNQERELHELRAAYFSVNNLYSAAVSYLQPSIPVQANEDEFKINGQSDGEIKLVSPKPDGPVNESGPESIPDSEQSDVKEPDEPVNADGKPDDAFRF